MTKAELIERIARARDLPADVTKKDIALILGIAFEELASYFAKAKVTRSHSPRFTFPHFGTFTKKRRSARRGVNPRTLQPMEIEAFDTVDFKAARELREAMNGGAEVAPRVSRRKKAAKNTVKSSSRGAAARRAGSGRRMLTPREDVELEAFIEEDELGDAELRAAARRTRSDRQDGKGEPAASTAKSAGRLPAGRLQRVESPEPEESRRRVRSRNLR